MIRFLASEPHYAEHLRPVFDAMPGDVDCEFVATWTTRQPTLTVVASSKDYEATSGPVVLFEHGAGFTYNTRHAAYAGGRGRERVVLFANVNESVHRANRRAYPDTPGAIVGAPKLDALLAAPTPTGETVAFSWHWDCRVAPETRTAWHEYRDHLQPGDATWTPLGHAHPRAWSMVRDTYRRLGWSTAETFREVIDRANVYVCDTSSTIYEFAALDRPVVVLNSKHYRRDVEQGLRFWRDIPGVQVNQPEELAAAIEEALHHDTWGPARRDIIGRVYPHLGQATTRAADAILGLL